MRAAFGAVAAGLLLACAAGTAGAQPVWQGPYIGASLGAQWGDVSNSGTQPSGGTLGAFGGYNWQNGGFIFGVEVDAHISNASDRFAAWQFSNPWFGTVRGRGGIAFNQALLYGTIGLAYGTLRAQSMVTGATERNTSLGLAFGGGAEITLTSRWRARVEYLYADFIDRSYALTGTSNGLAASLLRLGLYYRF